jgi:glutamate-ammonia-ligase adenylyltransferase
MNQQETNNETSLLENATRLIVPKGLSDQEAQKLLTEIGFSDWHTAHRRLLELCKDETSRAALAKCLPMLLVALSNAATPDGSLVNFERFVQCVQSREELFDYLASNPRAVEILVKLFVGSQFLTEILLRNPGYLDELTNHKRLAEFKSKQQFTAEALKASEKNSTVAEKLDALRRFQHWELLRIGACDSFGLFDLKSITVQLSLLTDSLVQSCLMILAEELSVSIDGFVVLAFGKLGGEELNYSSDIDLIFLSESDATKFWTLGQRLIKALMESTGEGFLYRVDMRLRPWGRSGALVNTVDSHINYLKKHGLLWEKQALLKARPIAGDLDVGQSFLQRTHPLIYGLPVDQIRESIQGMKTRIEEELERKGRKWGEVKSGEGSIRDIEFVTQFLQLSHGGDHPDVRSFNTMDGLVRLADFGFFQANEFRQLSTGYVFLRTIEHSLQMMHYKQTHSLPEDPRELAFLALRLDFTNAEQFLKYYRQHCEAIREIYEKYVGGKGEVLQHETTEQPGHIPDHRALMEPSYAETFNEEDIEHHAKLLKILSADNLVEIEASPAGEGRWQLIVVGYNHIGELSLMCGLLSVYGFDIADGNVFTAEQVSSDFRSGEKNSSDKSVSLSGVRKFVNVFTLRPSLETVLPEVWDRYKHDLCELVGLLRKGDQKQIQGILAKRVVGALRDVTETTTALYPIEVEIDNASSQRYTVLYIRAEDTTGFLYELTNGLALAGIDIRRVIVNSIGNRVFDTLFVTDASGEKITDLTRQRELRAAVMLIKHFTHLLPGSPNPEAALLHFRDFLEHLFQQPNWLEELATLERPDVLQAVAKLLGVSNFLWEDFLRLQHENLFPVVADVEALSEQKTRESIEEELNELLSSADDAAARIKSLNAFKDREMFRIDMRHILGHVEEFGQFSRELTDLAEVVVAAAMRICERDLEKRYGEPLLEDGSRCPLCVGALGKCGGHELGFASDIELMFLYYGNGKTTGPDEITTTEYFLKLVEAVMRTIQTRQEGIFQIDLRLRPYGRAGSLAVSLDAFETYFGPQGAAWPYERQALVKFRPIAGDPEFGRKIVALRDELIYTGDPFDVAAMRGMREKQVLQLVQAGAVNAKLSSGGLVDSEYIVQGLQISHGHQKPSLRVTNTLKAMQELLNAEILTEENYEHLKDAYIFQRRLIDALRMVRGHAKDLTVPTPDSEEFQFLARRLGYGNDSRQLEKDLERVTETVSGMTCLLDMPEKR